MLLTSKSDKKTPLIWRHYIENVRKRREIRVPNTYCKYGCFRRLVGDMWLCGNGSIRASYKRDKCYDV
jgi:hypothetical protein